MVINRVQNVGDCFEKHGQLFILATCQGETTWCSFLKVSNKRDRIAGLLPLIMIEGQKQGGGLAGGCTESEWRGGRLPSSYAIRRRGVGAAGRAGCHGGEEAVTGMVDAPDGGYFGEGLSENEGTNIATF
jgi:hypothetical protein